MRGLRCTFTHVGDCGANASCQICGWCNTLVKCLSDINDCVTQDDPQDVRHHLMLHPILCGWPRLTRCRFISLLRLLRLGRAYRLYGWVMFLTYNQTVSLLVVTLVRNFVVSAHLSHTPPGCVNADRSSLLHANHSTGSDKSLPIPATKLSQPSTACVLHRCSRTWIHLLVLQICFFVVHWAACIFYYIAKQSAFAETSWVGAATDWIGGATAIER